MLPEKCHKYSTAELNANIINARKEQKTQETDLIIIDEICVNQITQMQNSFIVERNSKRKINKYQELLKVINTCNNAKENAKHSKYLADQKLKSVEDCWHQKEQGTVNKIIVAESQFNQSTNTNFSVIDTMEHNNISTSQDAVNLTSTLLNPFHNNITYNNATLSASEGKLITREEAHYNARIVSRLSPPIFTEQEETSEINNSINWTEIFVYATGTLALLSAAKLLYCWGKVQLQRKIYPEVIKQHNEEEPMLSMEHLSYDSQIVKILISGDAGIIEVDTDHLNDL
ncbi:hypothetical protein [Candidatus Tisiphia endosymbiont of Nemotelus uliginosus]|uniref:hypothetical protein n=1 Tax=Candidatus Tisiphia endosymbiont of Nemotelus uliginosus TaxID=3077926 RepID=UPI0035C90FBC